VNLIDKQDAWDRVWAGLIAADKVSAKSADPVKSALDAITALLLQAEVGERLLAMAGRDDSDPTIGLLLSDADIAALKCLVSTAVWIRSEQLAHPNAVLHAHIRDEKAKFTGMYAEVDTHELAVARVRAEFDIGRALYTKLSTYCAEHAIPAPEWPVT
jgi:hypothetical protein